MCIIFHDIISRVYKYNKAAHFYLNLKISKILLLYTISLSYFILFFVFKILHIAYILCQLFAPISNSIYFSSKNLRTKTDFYS